MTGRDLAEHDSVTNYTRMLLDRAVLLRVQQREALGSLGPPDAVSCKLYLL